MKPLIFDNITYDKKYVEELKQPLLAVRDALIDADKLPFAMSLSQIHALLVYYQEQLAESK